MQTSGNDLFNSGVSSKDVVIEDLFNRFVEKMEISEDNSIGNIYISICELDPKLYLLCDGSKYRKYEPKYKKLYAKIGDLFKNDYKNKDSSHDNEVTDDEFCVPNMTGRAMIMQDLLGKLDDVRELGSNADFSIPASLLADFNFENQNSLAINTPTSTIVDEHTPKYKPFTNVGNHVFVASEYESFEIVKNGASDVRFDDRLRFDSKKVFFYIKYRNLNDIPNTEFDNEDNTIIVEDEMPKLD